MSATTSSLPSFDFRPGGKWIGLTLGARGEVSNSSSKLFLRVGNASFFILKQFGPDDSAKITSAIAKPEAFYLSAWGNIKCVTGDGSTFTFKNPLDKNKTTDYGNDTIAQLAAKSSQYVFDSSAVISPNLKFILKKQGNAWFLVLNSLHSKSFKDYYVNVTERTDAIKNWGATTVETDNYLNLQRVLRNACEALQVNPSRNNKNGNGGNSSSGDNNDSSRNHDTRPAVFLDPTCNMVYSDVHCTSSAFFPDNVVSRDPVQLARYKQPLNALGAAGKKGVPHCMCIGAPYNYVRSNADANTSFAFEFLGMKGCEDDLQMNICNIITEGGKVDISGSAFNMQCGGSAGEGGAGGKKNDTTNTSGGGGGSSSGFAGSSLQSDGGASQYIAQQNNVDQLRKSQDAFNAGLQQQGAGSGSGSGSGSGNGSGNGSAAGGGSTTTPSPLQVTPTSVPVTTTTSSTPTPLPPSTTPTPISVPPPSSTPTPTPISVPPSPPAGAGSGTPLQGGSSTGGSGDSKGSGGVATTPNAGGAPGTHALAPQWWQGWSTPSSGGTTTTPLPPSTATGSGASAGSWWWWPSYGKGGETAAANSSSSYFYPSYLYPSSSSSTNSNAGAAAIALIVIVGVVVWHKSKSKSKEKKE